MRSDSRINSPPQCEYFKYHLIKFVFPVYTPDASGVHDITEEYARTLEKTKAYAPIVVQEMFKAKSFAVPDENRTKTNIEGMFMLFYQNIFCDRKIGIIFRK